MKLNIRTEFISGYICDKIFPLGGFSTHFHSSWIYGDFNASFRWRDAILICLGDRCVLPITSAFSKIPYDLIIFGKMLKNILSFQRYQIYIILIN